MPGTGIWERVLSSLPAGTYNDTNRFTTSNIFAAFAAETGGIVHQLHAHHFGNGHRSSERFFAGEATLAYALLSTLDSPIRVRSISQYHPSHQSSSWAKRTRLRNHPSVCRQQKRISIFFLTWVRPFRMHSSTYTSLHRGIHIFSGL